jgi:hypothetical protein
MNIFDQNTYESNIRNGESASNFYFQEDVTSDGNC